VILGREGELSRPFSSGSMGTTTFGPACGAVAVAPAMKLAMARRGPDQRPAEVPGL